MNAIYSRQSVDKKDSISIESQIEFCKKEIPDEEYKIYTDRGYSGKDTHRPHFVNMINDIKSGLINKVIVYKLDRISRSVLDFSNIINIFEKYNVSFISSTEKFDTNTPIGKAMLNIIIVFAQLERETIQMRIKDNYYARGEKGFFMGGAIAYGFNKIKTSVNGIKTSTFENDIVQISNVIEMFELYANTDMSLSKISNYLNNDKKILSPNGRPWDSGKISRILRNPLYVKADVDVYLYYKNKECNITNDISDFVGINGCYLYGKREKNERKFTNVKDHVLSIGLHEGVIDSNTWLACQYKLDSNQQIKNSGKGKYSWLSGIIKCGYCNYSLSVVNTRGYKYFRCSGRTNLKICDGFEKPLHINEIENYVKIGLLERVERLKNVSLDIKEDNTDSNKIKLEIVQIDQQIENLMDSLAQASDITIKYVNERIAKLDQTKNRLMEEMKKNTIKNSKKIPINDVLERINRWDDIDIKQKKNICGFFIDRIYVKDDGIEINWKL